MSVLVVLLAAYGLVGLLSVRPVAGALAWRMFAEVARRYPTLYMEDKEPRNWHWFHATCYASALACVWPFVALFVLQGRSSRWKVGAERTALLEARRQRIAELEQELGIGEGSG